jgi:hypothetical protein
MWTQSPELYLPNVNTVPIAALPKCGQSPEKESQEVITRLFLTNKFFGPA